MHCLLPVCGEHSTTDARMEHCFMLATKEFVRPGLTKHLFEFSSGSCLHLFPQRGNAACRFISRNPFNSPHRKEEIAHADKFFPVNSCIQPIVKRVQIKPAQEHASAADLCNHSPAFLPRSVKHYEYGCAWFNHGSSRWRNSLPSQQPDESPVTFPAETSPVIHAPQYCRE